jgi:hypothetical protein
MFTLMGCWCKEALSLFTYHRYVVKNIMHLIKIITEELGIVGTYRSGALVSGTLTVALYYIVFKNTVPGR